MCIFENCLHNPDILYMHEQVRKNKCAEEIEEFVRKEKYMYTFMIVCNGNTKNCMYS